MIPDSLRERLYALYLERRDVDVERARLEATPAALREPHELHRLQWADFSVRRRLRQLVEDLRRVAA
jgi:hypothetical protein